MALSNNKITAPVSVDDVKSVLGESSNDLAALCKSSKINVLAKYKPTVYPSPFPDDWYKAKDGNYGINITVENGKSNWKDLVAEYSKTNNGYTTYITSQLAVRLRHSAWVISEGIFTMRIPR